MEKLKLIGLKKEVKEQLDKLKRYKMETYNEVVERLLKLWDLKGGGD